MSSKETEQVIRAYFDAVNRGDEAAINALTAEDFEFRMMARSPDWLGTRLNRDNFAKTPALLSQFMAKPIRIDVVSIVADGDRAAVEAVTDAQMLNGTRYNNAYHFAFTLKDNKLRELREYGCSHLTVACFPELAPREQPAAATG